MATSDNFSKTFSTGYTLKVAWTESGVDVGSNTSDLTVTVYLVCGGNSSTGYYINSSVKKNISLTVNGTTYTGTCSINCGRGETVTLFTKTISDIPHDSNGAKTVAISCTTGIKATLNGSYISSASVSGNAALTTIARASQPSCVTWPDHTQNVGSFGDTISIHMNRNSDAFTHTVRYEFGSLTGTCINAETGKATNKDVTTGFKWTIPKSLMDLIPNTDKGSGTIYVDTYNGSTFIDTKSCGFTATVPTTDDCYPSCSLLLKVVGDAGTRYDRPVKGLTQIEITVNSTLAYSSPIDTCTINVDGVTYSGTTVTTAILQKSGSSPITATVKDKRGRPCKVAASYTMTVLDYHSPSITKLSVNRCDFSGNEDDQGDYVKVTLSADISSMEGSLTENRNTAVYTLSHKPSSDANWQEIDMSGYNDVYSLDNEEFIFYADGNSAHDIRVTATDFHSPTSTKSTSVSTAFTLMNFHPSGTGIGFGKISEKQNTFECALDARMAGKLDVDGGLNVTGSLNAGNGLNVSNPAYLKNDVSQVGHFRAVNNWFGMYGSKEDAYKATNRKGWIGYDNSTILRIYDETGGIDYISKSNQRWAVNGTNVTELTTTTFRPISNDTKYLGDATYRWKAVYAVNGTIQTSDRNKKKDIEELDQRYIDLFDRLMPVSFMFNDEESDRTHIGFISQDVEAAMVEVGLTNLDFAGFCKDVKVEWDEESRTDKPVLDKDGKPVYIYSLRYTEFIALNTKMIQMVRKETASLRAELDELKQLVLSMNN